MDQVEDALIPLVRYLSSPRTWRQIAAATDVPLDRARYVVLRAVAEGEPLRTTSLAERVGVDPSTMSRHVTLLERDGLVGRIADPDDGRAQSVSLTPAGRDVMEQRPRRPPRPHRHGARQLVRHRPPAARAAARASG